MYNYISFRKLFVSAKMSWNLLDKNFQNFSDHLWDIYFAFLKRFENVNFNLQKNIAELNAAICNPEVFKEYLKKKEGKEMEFDTEYVTTKTGVTKGLKDSKGNEISINKLEELINKAKIG